MADEPVLTQNERDARLEHPSVDYERSDANVRAILYVMAVTVVFGVVVHLGLTLLLHAFADHQAELKRSSFPLAMTPSNTLPPEPRLEQLDRLRPLTEAEARNLVERDKARWAALNSYGEAAGAGFVHIPIEQAMKHLVQEKKLPSRAEPPAEELRRSGGLIDAGESNSGRLFKRNQR